MQEGFYMGAWNLHLGSEKFPLLLGQMRNESGSLGQGCLSGWIALEETFYILFQSLERKKEGGGTKQNRKSCSSLRQTYVKYQFQFVSIHPDYHTFSDRMLVNSQNYNLK
ncbi:Hypothetical predicted protein [Podarcis lilfordi]|uniref:Uncharacterized protein n=1 Tax=Podarcis lilfordi TaxID=74358 RepID=A0AA35LBX2_9SAUR|nr:Hypothetical predicted protein [Podarcis lilfordi]